ncbi:hypothetical protein BmR1_04g05465 [Babesia microti strain RI]|uniref:Ribosomal eL28/Mak16 domain-containing protein n=1 Tax=Babesia microti (strain RI) TaxID=1133968 RepID=I7IS38_BABMR|nr:hypothetical protein BmR1_04g05465 [Babesia microti strain RI]CCF75291.1 hypothetical protein BmR1_04g05465 [Babesia microti strain RI]|eukprot:XP_012649699.1 hypothetical protein BmR1_04g05465 [Babesia microti strain RI]
MVKEIGTAPDCLLWQLVKHNHSKLIKSGKFTFSREVGNITNQHTAKNTGYTNKKRIDVLSACEGSSVKLFNDTGHTIRRPKSRLSNKNFTKSLKNQAIIRDIVKKTRPQLAFQISQKFSKLVTIKTIDKTD